MRTEHTASRKSATDFQSGGDRIVACETSLSLDFLIVCLFLQSERTDINNYTILSHLLKSCVWCEVVYFPSIHREAVKDWGKTSSGSRAGVDSPFPAQSRGAPWLLLYQDFIHTKYLLKTGGYFYLKPQFGPKCRRVWHLNSVQPPAHCR